MPPSYKTGDTWPKLTGSISDDDGLVDLSSADSVRIIMKVGSTVVTGPVDVLVALGHWSYTPAAGDFDVVGEYEVEIEVTWDAGTTPPEIETYPNDEANNPTIHVTADLD